MIKATMVVAMVGKVGRHDVLTEEALLWMRDRLQGTDKPKATVRIGRDTIECPIDPTTCRVEQLGDGRWALKAELELPDELAEEKPVILGPHAAEEMTASERRHAFENAPRETA